jgi:isopentenyldiphosphate isomerase
MNDELLDLVDENDKVIGTILRSDYDRLVKEKLGYIRVAEMFIQNSEGKFWVPKRTAHKKIAPGGLDYSMGGHVSSGESYLESALREIQEELNLNLNGTDLKFVHKFPPSEIPYFRALYIYESDTEPEYNPDDYVSASWLTPQEILKKLNDGVAAKTSLRETIEFLLANS